MIELFRNPNFDFIGRRRWAYIISILFILAGLGSMVAKGGLRYGIEVRPSGAVTATFAESAILVTLPRARLDLWLRPGEVSVEGSQPIGGGKVLQILLEKDEARLGRDGGGDDSVA